MISNRLRTGLVVLSLCLGIAPVLAALVPTPIATVTKVRGTATVWRGAAAETVIQAGDRIALGDRVKTGSDGKIVLLFDDGSVRSVGPNLEREYNEAASLETGLRVAFRRTLADAYAYDPTKAPQETAVFGGVASTGPVGASPLATRSNAVSSNDELEEPAPSSGWQRARVAPGSSGELAPPTPGPAPAPEPKAATPSEGQGQREAKKTEKLKPEKTHPGHVAPHPGKARAGATAVAADLATAPFVPGADVDLWSLVTPGVGGALDPTAPEVSWNVIEGATAYRVRVLSPGNLAGEHRTDATRFMLPLSKVDLQAAERLKLEIEALRPDDGIFSKTRAFEVGVLTERQLGILTLEREYRDRQIVANPDLAEALDLALAATCLKFGLHGDVIRLLEPLVTRLPQALPAPTLRVPLLRAYRAVGARARASIQEEALGVAPASGK